MEGKWGDPICRVYHCHEQAEYMPIVEVEGGLSIPVSMCSKHYFTHMNTVWTRERNEKSV